MKSMSAQDVLVAFDVMFGYAQWKASPYPVEVSYRRDRAKAGQFLRDCLQTEKTELAAHIGSTATESEDESDAAVTLFV